MKINELNGSDSETSMVTIRYFHVENELIAPKDNTSIIQYKLSNYFSFFRNSYKLLYDHISCGLHRNIMLFTYM